MITSFLSKAALVKGLKSVIPLIPYLVVVGIVAGAGMFVYNRGLHTAYERAAQTHERVIAQLHADYEEQLQERDEEWGEEVSSLLSQVQRAAERDRLDRERQRELEETIRSLSTSLQEIQQDVYESEIGTCSVSPEFDRVLNRARTTSITP